jgi:lipoprotein-anchoring transpeptidase ErfK/SrfK
MRLLLTICIALLFGLGTTATAHAVGQRVLEPNGLMIPDGGIVQGLVEISGIAQHPTFRKWQLDLQLHGDPAQTNFVAVSETPLYELARLTALDTTLYPNGKHMLRLRVVHSNLNYDEYFTPLTIDNPNVSVTIAANSLPPVADNDVADNEAADADTAPAVVLDRPLGENVPNGERRIEVDLSEQILTAWQGDVVVLRTIVSTGRAEFPTVLGTWPIRTKLTSTRMIGPGYNTPDVPWTMYYFRGYAIHGAYWHDNFGTPVSHGCVNMRPAEAKLLFDWASEGTNVTVHE